MKIIKQKVSGALLQDGPYTALRWDEADDSIVYLTYALVTQGPENQVIPALLLDDWGGEIKTLKLYRWIQENGPRFPRAEIFGLAPTGEPVQYFVRDLELLTRYPAYATTDKNRSIADWFSLDAVLVPDAGAGFPERISVLDEAPGPLRQAKVSWWRVATGEMGLDFLESGRAEVE